ncbi:MAG: nuclear transport factor 2 family protein [Gaiellaceae bacterium]
MTEPTSEHPNVALAKRLFDAFGRRDGAVVAALLDKDVVWRVGCETPVSGEYVGRRAVVAFLGMTTRTTDGTYRSTLHYAVADDERMIAYYRANGVRNGIELDSDQLLLCRIYDGRLIEVTAVPVDHRAFEAFWA